MGRSCDDQGKFNFDDEPGGSEANRAVVQRQVFDFRGHEVRVLIEGKEWLFVVKDLADALEFSHAPHAARLLRPQHRRGVRSVDTPGGPQSMAVCTESGAFRLAMRAKSKGAVDFQDWLTDVVLPALNRHGTYTVGQEFSIPKTLSEALRLAADLEDARGRAVARADAAEQEVKALAPAAASWAELASAEGDFSLRHAAHILNRAPGIEIGQNRLMKRIKALGWADENGIPYASKSKWVRERPQSYEHPRTGERVIGRPQVRITVDGLQRLHQLLGDPPAGTEGH